jgi:short-subunit dehydrogenase
MSTFVKSGVVWITGASTGIGRGLALSFAADGYKVAASARSVDKLRELEQASGNITAFQLDVTDAAAAAAVYATIESALGPVTIAILNAGVWHPMTASTFDVAQMEDSISVNYLGVVNALAPAMQAMTARKTGHIAIMSSVAGYRGMPKGAAYAPTKAALISLAESLYIDLKHKGVSMTVINPGFIATPMTSVNTFPMPFIVTSDEAVATIRKGLNRGKFEIVFPGRMALMMKTFRLLPYSLYFWTADKITKRKLPPEDGA